MNTQRSIDKAVLDRERRLTAIAISRGIGIGRVIFLHADKRQQFRVKLDPAAIGSELERLHSAVDATIAQLNKLSADAHSDPDHPISSIFGVHVLILEESSFVRRVEEAIRDQRVNAEWAVRSVAEDYLQKQGSITDDHFREKYLDIEDVASRLLSNLEGSGTSPQLTYSGAVIAARELRPSAIMELMKVKPAAVITERGGWTSHASILAREFKLPMVSGVKDMEHVLSSGHSVIVDGARGEIILMPERETVEHFRSIQSAIENSPRYRGSEPQSALFTKDGTEILLRANIDVPAAYNTARNFGARGIGLFRSESLIAHPGEIPTEDDQYEAYAAIADSAGESGVRIRTFDIGTYRSGDAGFTGEHNPALGLRAIRLSLTETHTFRHQVRAILRASAGRNIDIILPMITGVEEVKRARSIIGEVRDDLVRAGTAVGDPGLGIMIEVPSAVFTADEIARHCDFFCLGTNDLVQYLLAVDRDNDFVADWYQTLHPAVLRAVSAVLAAAGAAGIPAEVCGEMAGSPFYVPLLIGLGTRELSVNVNSIPHIRRLVAGIEIGKAEELAVIASEGRTAAEVETVLRKYYFEHWVDLFPVGLLNNRHR